jgi:putative phosphoesterase
MKVAVFSDIHENFHNFRIAFKQMQNHGVEEGICLGDYINPGIAKEIFESFKQNNIKLHGIFGNNDGDRARIMEFVMQFEINHSVAEFMDFEINGKKVFITHYPEIGKVVDRTKFDAIFFGHDHEMFIDQDKNIALLANPGELSSHITGVASFLIWDTEKKSIEHIILDKGEILNPKS